MTSHTRYILITGATDGIGKETARELARSSENFVVIHGRNEEKCKATIEEINSSISDKDQDYQPSLDFVVADFSKLSEVSKMADEVETRFPCLNILLCNAGVLLPKRQATSDGFEMTFQVNHLAHFLLVNKLLELLKKNQPSRIVIMSSISHAFYSMKWDDLQAEKQYEKHAQYSRTKLANLLFGFALARKLEDSGITCNVVEPGIIQTKLLAAGGFQGAPPEKGITAPLHLITASEVEGVNGKYFSHKAKLAKSSNESTKVENQDKLWELTEEMVEKFIKKFLP